MGYGWLLRSSSCDTFQTERPGDFSNGKRLIIVVQHSPVVTKAKLAENSSLAKQQTDSYEKREPLRQKLVLPLSRFIMTWTRNSSLYVRLRQP